MAREFLQEAFRKLNVLNEEIFDSSDDGIKGLAALRADDENKYGDEESIEIIDADAERPEDLQTSYEGKVILECPVCHSFLFNNVDDIVIDRTSDVANVDKECPYCCSVGGFTIVGQVGHYDGTESTEDDTAETTDTVETEDSAEADDVEIETSEEETPEDSADEETETEETDTEETEETEEDSVEEGLLGSVAKAVSNIPVIGGLLGEDECSDKECEESIQKCDSTCDNKITDALNDNLGQDAWTSYTYDDEDTTEPIEVFNGTELIGRFTIDADGGLISVDSVNEDLTVNVGDDGVKIDSSEEGKSVTVSDTEVTDVVETPVEEVATEETTEEVPAGDETVQPVDIDTKSDIEDNTDDEDTEVIKDEPVEDAKEVSETEEEEEVEESLEDFDETAFDSIGEKFLKRTYENVESYKTTSATSVDNTLKLEGVIKFKSGKERPTTFVFEAKDITPRGKARFVGENLQISKAKKAFSVSGKLGEGKFIAESLNYNYSAKNPDGKSTRVYGTVTNRK